MSSGQEATCDCAQCVKHRGGTWLEVHGEAIKRAERERQISAAADDAPDTDPDAWYAEELERLRERGPA